MNALIKVEEAAMFAACVLLFPQLELSWWWFAGCILLPDVGMIGYVANNRIGAFSYNLFHHRAVAIAVGLFGLTTDNTWVQFIGLILFAHAAMDRMLGYGLKYESGFKFTHLGEIGKKK
ncbi:MAG: DUF4260 domain-containing protein [Bacteroidota bacterium]